MAKTASVDLSEILKRLKSDRANLVAGGTPDAAIEELEEELEIDLPQSYKQFLRIFDGGEFGFGRMHAITPAGAGWFDFRLELERFFEMYPRMGVRNVVPFARSYGSDVYCFDMNNVRGGEPEILMFDGELGQDQQLREEAVSFGEWIKKHYQFAEIEQHWLELYIGSEGELAPDIAGIPLQQVHESDNVAMRCHLQFHPPYVYEMRFVDGVQGFKANEEAEANKANRANMEALAELLKQVLAKKGAQPVELFVYDSLEMNSHPKYKTIVGTLQFGDTPIELKAGDRLKLSPNGAIEVVAASPLENHVSRPTVRTQMCCSFCGKEQDEVDKLIAGPGIQICNECVELCWDILNEDKNVEAPVTD